MYRLLSDLTAHHEPRLTVLAVVVCMLACGSGFWLFGRLRWATPRRQRWVLLLSGATVAVGIWSTHYIGILAYNAGLPVTFNLPFAILALLLAFATAAAGIAMSKLKMRFVTTLSGAVIGLGISAANFMAMRGVVVAGRVSWDESTVVATVFVGIAISILAMQAHRSLPRSWRVYGASALLVLAICITHFTTMTAATFTPNVAIVASETAMRPFALGLFVTIVTLVALLTAVGAALYERLTIVRAVVAIGTAIMVTLVTMIAVGLFTIDQVRIGGQNFQRIAASKDLVADVLPPPAYIIEAYLETRILASDPDNIAYHARRLQTLRRDYEGRQAFWLTSPLIPEDTRKLLTVDSDAHVRLFWAELEDKFLPAISRFNSTEIQEALQRLSIHYQAHRSVVEKLVKLADTQSSALTDTFSAHAEVLEQLVIAAVIVLLLTVGSSVWALRAHVVQPMLSTASYLDVLRAGHYENSVPFTERRDEIGHMAQAIDTLRLDALEKQRLEREAESARHAREKERVAEALRLRLANEHMTDLNDRLTKAITQLERAQEDNLRKARLAQLGQLTATVAHEIRNPLGAIKTATYLIERKTKDKELGIEGPIQRVNNGIQRCDTIITELLDFTRTKALATTAHSVDAWVAEVIAEERRNVPKQVAIEVRASIETETAMFDSSQMRRVMVNLISNASEAMVGKAGQPPEMPTVAPKITITTRVMGANVEIIVADNGPGISPENIERIREPLFTTKSFGVGLGVPAVETILEQHGGGLRIVSAPGEGAVFTAWFPRHQDAGTASSDAGAVA